MLRLAALLLALVLVGCTGTAPAPSSVDAALAAPALTCEAQGGRRTVERGTDGEIGVCVFPDGRQCEERALQLGECPRGGIPIGSYATTSERHCAIRGGRMTIPGCALSPVGIYEAGSVVLVIQAGRSAVLRTVQAGSTTLLQATWQSSGNHLTLSTERERLVFDYAADRLIAREWDRRLWGAEGPGTLVRRK